jgi:hypothetical protein
MVRRVRDEAHVKNEGLRHVYLCLEIKGVWSAVVEGLLQMGKERKLWAHVTELTTAPRNICHGEEGASLPLVVFERQLTSRLNTRLVSIVNQTCSTHLVNVIGEVKIYLLRHV